MRSGGRSGGATRRCARRRTGFCATSRSAWLLSWSWGWTKRRPTRPWPPSDPPLAAAPSAPLERASGARAASRARRQARYDEVQTLLRAGRALSAVARRMHLARQTVRTLAYAPDCPTPAARPRLLAPFEPYLRHRWAHGCRNARALFEGVRAGGYRGSYAHLRHALSVWRDEPARHGRSARGPTPSPPTLPAPRPVSPRRARWLLLRPAEDLDAAERAFLAHLRTARPDLGTLQELRVSPGVPCPRPGA